MKEIKLELTGLSRETEEKVKAREKAMYLLSFKDYTESAMYERLLKCGFSPEISAEVTGYLVQRKYIDEERYFERYFEYLAYKKYYGKSRILLEARQKGFSKSTVEESFDKLVKETSFIEICSEFIKKSRKTDISDKKSRDKLIASLLRRGFSMSEIREAFEKLFD